MNYAELKAQHPGVFNNIYDEGQRNGVFQERRRAMAEGPAMTLTALKAQHPEVYAAACAEGITHERERCRAHLAMGSAAGDMTAALKAVEDGTALTAMVQARYLIGNASQQSEDETEVVVQAVERLLGVPQQAGK